MKGRSCLFLEALSQLTTPCSLAGDNIGHRQSIQSDCGGPCNSLSDRSLTEQVSVIWKRIRDQD